VTLLELMKMPPAECFARAVAAAGGMPVALNDGASKMLRLLLEDDSDCELTATSFLVDLARCRRYPYDAWTAPGIVSWLVERIGPSSSSSVTGIIVPTTVPYRVHKTTWSLAEPRWVRLETHPTHLSLRFRTTPEGLARELP
jgi:hypothetical protein